MFSYWSANIVHQNKKQQFATNFVEMQSDWPKGHINFVVLNISCDYHEDDLMQ